MKECKFCSESCQEDYDIFLYKCKSCPKYRVNPFSPGSFESQENDKLNVYINRNKDKIEKNLHNIRGYLKEKEVFTVTTDNIEYLTCLKDKTPLEKMKMLLDFIDKKSNLGDNFYIDDNGKDFAKLAISDNLVEGNLSPIIWARSRKEIYEVQDYLLKSGYIEKDWRGDCKITLNGHDFLEKDEIYLDDELNKKNTEINLIFFNPEITVQKFDKESFKKYFGSFGITSENGDKLIEELENVPESSKPKVFFEKASDFIKSIGADIATNLVVKGVSAYFGI